MRVFIAEPIKDRLVTDPREDDAAEDAADRQEYLDLISGWSPNGTAQARLTCRKGGG